MATKSNETILLKISLNLNKKKYKKIEFLKQYIIFNSFLTC